MAKPPNKALCIVGQGLAGTCLAWALEQAGVDWCLIDRGIERSSSWAAAGLVTPITGKGLNPSWQIQAFYPEAERFYREWEQRWQCSVWHPTSMLRLFSNQKERAKWLTKCGEPELLPWVEASEVTEHPERWPFGGFLMRGGAWLDTRAFLQASRDAFAAMGRLETREVSFADALADEKKTWIFCDGAAGLLARRQPHRCAKGEILTVHIPDWEETRILNQQGWIVPLGNSLYRVGATYSWDRLDGEITEQGRSEVEAILRRFCDLPYTIEEQVAGIRPIIRQSQPQWASMGNHWSLNGLGSKGTLYAPGMGRRIADYFTTGKPVWKDLDGETTP